MSIVNPMDTPPRASKIPELAMLSRHAVEIIPVANGVVVRPTYRPDRDGMVALPEEETYVFTHPEQLNQWLIKHMFDMGEVLKAEASKNA